MGGLAALLTAFWASTKIKLAVGTGIAALLLCALVPGPWKGAPSSALSPIQETNESGTRETAIAPQGVGNDSTAGDSSEPEPTPPLDQGELQLCIVAAEGGQPAAGVDVSCSVPESSIKKYRSDRNGSVRILFPTNTTSLELYVTSEGFADTRLAWRLDRGEMIPRDYVLRLTTPVWLGGSVVDADGGPVSGAQVMLQKSGDAIDAPRPETHTARVEISTDAAGRWQASRIAPELVRQLRVYASHPEHAQSTAIRVGKDAEAERQLREGTCVLRLGSAGVVRGVVVDPEGNPVDKAQVLIGRLYTSDSKKLQTAADGYFEAGGCARGKATITVEAEGFAPTGAEADVDAAEPVRIVLSRGKSLLVKVVDRDGRSLAGAGMGVRAARDSVGFVRAGVPEFALHRKTDADGRALLSHVPDMDLDLGVWADGYMDVCGLRVRRDEVEVLVTLQPPLIVSGTVRDATTGKPIPKFKIATGRPEPQGPNWSGIDQFHPAFEGGTFRHVYDEAVVCEVTNSGYVLKFEAEGYAPHVSRLIAADEGEVRMEVVLLRATPQQIQVLNPDGSPASWAEVGFPELAAGNPLMLVPGGLDLSYTRADGALQKTDSEGRFKLPLDAAIRRVVAANSAGYADVSTEGLADAGVVQLLPWGRIEGFLLDADSQPSTNFVAFLFNNTDGPDGGIIADIYSSFHVKPDLTGFFTLPMVPAGRHGVLELISRAGGWSHGRRAEIEIRSGQTAQATFGNTSAPNAVGHQDQ